MQQLIISFFRLQTLKKALFLTNFRKRGETHLNPPQKTLTIYYIAPPSKSPSCASERDCSQTMNKRNEKRRACSSLVKHSLRLNVKAYPYCNLKKSKWENKTFCWKKGNLFRSYIILLEIIPLHCFIQKRKIQIF